MATRDEPPIACTLSSGDLAARLAWIRRLTHESLLSHRLEGRTLHLRYRPGAGADLERIVELERACCAFLEFALVREPSAVALIITAPPGVDDGAPWLFEQFLPEAPARAACGCSAVACASR